MTRVTEDDVQSSRTLSRLSHTASRRKGAKTNVQYSDSYHEAEDRNGSTDRPSDMHVIVMYVYKCSFMCEGRSGEKIKTHLSESEEGGGAREARALF